MNDRTMFTRGNTNGYTAEELERANRLLADWDHEHPDADDDARAAECGRILKRVEGK